MFQTRSRPVPSARDSFLDRLFDAQSAARGGVVRRSVRSVEREVGREALVEAVRARGFHLVECGDQFIVICNTGLLRVVC